MTNILVYDTEERRIQQWCEKYDLTEAEVVELILDQIDPDTEDDIFR